MAEQDDFRMQPAEVIDATKQLDELAARIDRIVEAERANLVVTAPGRDEVSQRVAATLNEVRVSFVESTDKGSNEIREIAATLRSYAHDISAVDEDFLV